MTTRKPSAPFRGWQQEKQVRRQRHVGASQFFYDRRMTWLWGSTVVTLEMIKWEHSVFALPFALTGAVLAAGGWPTLRVLGWIVVCMVAARSAAMAFNRLGGAGVGGGDA